MKTVWLIGAGASLSNSSGHFPTLLGIPKKAEERGVLADARSSHGFAELNRYLNSRNFGSLTSKTASINLEHVLTLLEIDIAVASDPRLQIARDFLIRMIRLTLVRLHSTNKVDNQEYKRMAGMLNASDTIITFNWDYLLDNVLGRLSRIPKKTEASPEPDLNGRTIYDRFLLEMTGWGERTVDWISPPSPAYQLEDRGYFIKAHGSIDWYYCRNPICRSHEKVFPMRAVKKRPVCLGCREKTDVLIVPPTLNKRLRDVPLTRRLWTLAATEIASAETITCWGYSLPPTDFFSDWLLRESRKTICSRIVIINPAVARGTRVNREFVERLTKPLGAPRSSLKVELYRTFTEFERGTPIG